MLHQDDYKQHISAQFNAELEAVKNNLLEMGGKVEQQMAQAVEALLKRDSGEAELVIAGDKEVNDMEISIDDECARILARRQPAASDLRLVRAVAKLSTDLERIGDEAEKIGFLASRLAAMDRPSDSYRELKNLGNHVLHMLRDAMNAFARLDVEEALEVVREDERVDEEYEAIQRQCITFMMEDPRSIKRVMNVTWASRSLERIGDHSKNICEYVIYMVEGKDVRHTDILEHSGVKQD